ncbi:hypothetical protein [Bradyrhizobium sp. WD16]|uniref:hypothetical protein n=1 Tax=Bradyrhizobium sp. WD16 TaxID=1521768 RepID=UPI0020A2BB22|nr:hypothetical protein [Bradyrhizobium sp. WD16]UTD28835.1 hypothetical protein DB459_19965 [Bradyrhizobium sp. WD16]
MRRFILASAAVAALAAGALGVNRAEAMTLPGVAKADRAAEQVYVRCTRFWNGYRWVRRCVDVDGGYYGGGYYAPRPRYYAPRPYYYGPRPWGWY